MMSGTAKRDGFLSHHRHDRSMVIVVVGAIWLTIVLGFGIDMVKRAHNHTLSFSLITHLHAVAYTGWLVLLAAQVFLVRTGRIAAHRWLGRASLILLPAMLFLGPATAYYGVADNPYMPDKWIAWLSVNYTNAVGAIALLVAGFLTRRSPATHKRLMVLGTIALTEPGFSRIWMPFLEARLGEGYVAFYFSTYIGTLLLVVGVGAYDLATRRRLHPAYIAAALWIIANEVVADWLFHQSWWLQWMKASTGHRV
ncbi:hypothetical protein [Sphingomonas sp. BAUL-RG-20F-R05-02]|uniref:hypothetical protein n=1 Tax=Sphingomonas sp. BAUL-RG-20F-R05-02 TaxID=2914830 RepID=UPI001F5A08F8|nr:hypothetical protein [Sphingomonas sp. BAUL-RG-20F-R05-02]